MIDNRDRWGDIWDLIHLARSRWLSERRGAHSAALARLDTRRRRNSKSDRLVQLYRLRLMIALGDPRRHSLVEALAKEQWPSASDDDRYLNAYRRLMMHGLSGDRDETEQAATELRESSALTFIRHTLPPLGLNWQQK